MKKAFLLLGSLLVLGSFSVSAMAADECIAGQVTGMSLETEFGPGVSEITRCLTKGGQVKLVIQVNKACRDTTVVATNSGYAIENHARSCTPGNPSNPLAYGRGYGIAQAKAMINDYTITNGILPQNLDINLIVHGGGGTMLLNTPWNKLKDDVKHLMDKGVKIHFCMNTVRGMSKKMGISTTQFTSMVIPGVTYVTGGMTALQEFQNLGYTYLQP